MKRELLDVESFCSEAEQATGSITAKRNASSPRPLVRKRAARWVAEAPRCLNCQYFRSSNSYLVDSQPRRTKPFCVRLDAITTANAHCLLWGKRIEP